MELQLSHFPWEPSDELQESLGPSAPEIEKESKKSLSAPDPKKSRKSLEKSGKSLENVRSRFSLDFFQTFWVRETLFRFFLDFGPGGPSLSLSISLSLCPCQSIFSVPPLSVSIALKAVNLHPLYGVKCSNRLSYSVS